MRRHKRESNDAEVDLTPMLDITFIMLIFFIVTATFTKEIGIDVTRPQDEEENQQQSNAVAILLQITDSNDIYIFEPEGQRRIDLRAVTANVQRKFAESPESSVIVQPSPKTDTGVMIEVMDAAKQAGVPSVSLGEIHGK